MSWFQKLLPPKIKRKVSGEKKAVPEGLWSKCASCEAVLYYSDLGNNLNVCPKCNHHNRISARVRLDLFLDAEGRHEIGAEVQSLDPLKFKDNKRYIDRLAEAKRDTDENDALVVMQGSVKTIPLVAAAFEFGFMGGSMGSAVGERFVRAVQTCVEQHVAFVCFAASGGARMQEGLLSLMQMAKTTAVLTQLSQERLPFISVLTDPTIAGPRVIEQTVRQTLPEGFQRAEFLLEHGAIDMIVDRRRMRDKVANLCSLLMRVSPPEA